jgi:hypothetical protein
VVPPAAKNFPLALGKRGRGRPPLAPLALERDPIRPIFFNRDDTSDLVDDVVGAGQDFDIDETTNYVSLLNLPNELPYELPDVAPEFVPATELVPAPQLLQNMSGLSMNESEYNRRQLNFTGPTDFPLQTHNDLFESTRRVFGGLTNEQLHGDFASLCRSMTDDEAVNNLLHPNVIDQDLLVNNAHAVYATLSSSNSTNTSSASASVVLGDVSSSISSSSIASNNTTDLITAKKKPGRPRLTEEVVNERAAIKAQEKLDNAAKKANKIKR